MLLTEACMTQAFHILCKIDSIPEITCTIYFCLRQGLVTSQTPKDFQRKSKTAQLGNIKTVGSRMENDD